MLTKHCKHIVHNYDEHKLRPAVWLYSAHRHYIWFTWTCSYNVYMGIKLW